MIATTNRTASISAHSRRGAITLIAIFMIVTGVLVTALVVDWAYLVAVNRGMEDVAGIMALAAAPDLLDQNLLLDANGPPMPNQASARATALVSADQYRQYNNAVLPSLQQTASGDVTVQTGFVADVSLPLLDPTPLEHNTVFVAITRSTTGSHPVVYPVGLSGGTVAAEIRGALLCNARQSRGRLHTGNCYGASADAAGYIDHVLDHRANGRFQWRRHSRYDDSFAIAESAFEPDVFADTQRRVFVLRRNL